MDRQPPHTLSDEIDLSIRTYYSLLRSSGEVRVRAFEEAHTFSSSSLHEGARSPTPDVAAFAYCAARLPECFAQVSRVVLGQSHEQFEAALIPAREWKRVRTRGRRRPLRWNGAETLAAFVTSTSDIDDLVPLLTAYQIEWNKIHERLASTELGRALRAATTEAELDTLSYDSLGTVLGLDAENVLRLTGALGVDWRQHLRRIAQQRSDRLVRLLSGSFSEYQRAAQRWWGSIEPVYVRETIPRRRPVYFVSSNTHSIINLLGGYARAHRNEIVTFAQKYNPENLAPDLNQALAQGNDDEVSNLTYYLLRAFLHEAGEGIQERIASVQKYDSESGIQTIEAPGKIDVSAQIIELNKLRFDRLDPRVSTKHMERLKESEAIILNIDYPLGMASYHLFARLAQGIGELRGMYVMGKAATLNGRVGDVLISTVIYDEHSHNTYLYRNCFNAADVQPFMRAGTVLDNQKALSVRGTFLQNREYMSTFYRNGYTVLEMEAGPYLSAIYELVYPNRHPDDEIVHLSTVTSFDVGILHYASDTPYSRRQNLLSKSMSYFGVDSTYSCSIAIVRRILERELRRLDPAASLDSVYPSQM